MRLADETTVTQLADTDTIFVTKDGEVKRMTKSDFRNNVGGGTAEGGNKVAETPSSVITFTNPPGHIRSSPLSGAQSFTKTGSILTEVVQPYTADGTATIAFNFTHKILNSSFVSGGALAAGEYELYFSNRGSYVSISIATVGSGGSGTPSDTTAPTDGTLTISNIQDMTATATWTAATDA